MITWFQNLFLKHNKVLFGGLLIVIIFAFVFTIGNFGPGGGSGRPGTEPLPFYGYDLNNPNQVQQLATHGRVSSILQGQYQMDPNLLQQYALVRAVALGLANEMGIAAPNDEQLQAYIRRQPIFQNPNTQAFDPNVYQQLLTGLTASFGGEAALARVLREDYRVERVTQALGGPVYQLPYEILQDYRIQNSRFDVALARLPFASFQPTLEPSDDELRSFYEQNPTRFEDQEQMFATAVYFNTENFLERVPVPTEAELQSYFERFRSRYDVDPNENAEDLPPIQLDQVRNRVTEDWRFERARSLAEESAENFILALYERAIARESTAFEDTIREFGGISREMDPFGREGLGMLSLPQKLSRDIWEFAETERYFTDPDRSTQGAVVLVRDAVNPPLLRPFEEVRERVITAYTEERKRELFLEEGRRLREEIQERLSEGETFAEIAEDLSLTVEDIEPFQGNDTPLELLQAGVTSVIPDLETGEISTFNRVGDAGVLVYMQERQSPEVGPDSPEVVALLEERRQSDGTAEGWQILAELMVQALPADEQRLLPVE